MQEHGEIRGFELARPAKPQQQPRRTQVIYIVGTVRSTYGVIGELQVMSANKCIDMESYW